MIEIRTAAQNDQSEILTIYNDAVMNTTAVYDYTPRSKEAQKRWFATKREQGLPVLVVENSGTILGFASFGPFRPWPAYAHTVESSIYIAPASRGKGIGTLLLGRLVEIAAERRLHPMVAGIDAANEASLRLHAKFSFTEVAHFREVGWKFERWLDLVFLERLL